ncbi:MAG TPA: hypothetical protein VHB69_08745 [Mycobacteriales bacterium]|nr:hypothetical protein [Mycobacteriales bacterium]
MSLDEELLRQASEFADKLNARIARILPDPQPRFLAQILATRKPSLTVTPVRDDDPDRGAQPLTLTVKGRVQDRQLHLRALFWCCYDYSGQYLTIEKSDLGLGLAKSSEPFFRVEYDRNMDRKNRLPAAHFQVHGHRDDMTSLMLHADEHRPRERWRAGRFPRLSAFHFPVGGDRYRPCIEDILSIAVKEFGVRTIRGAWEALDEGRAEWRRVQLAAAVRDAPEIAAAALRGEGWSVRGDPNSNRRERTDRLSQI